MAFAFFKCAPRRRSIPTQSFIRAEVGAEHDPLPSGMYGSPFPTSGPATRPSGHRVRWAWGMVAPDSRSPGGEHWLSPSCISLPVPRSPCPSVPHI